MSAFSGINDAFKYVWKTEGVPGFFKGFRAEAIRIVPYSAIQFCVYEMSKKVKKHCLKHIHNIFQETL